MENWASSDTKAREENGLMPSVDGFMHHSAVLDCLHLKAELQSLGQPWTILKCMSTKVQQQARDRPHVPLWRETDLAVAQPILRADIAILIVWVSLTTYVGNQHTGISETSAE